MSVCPMFCRANVTLGPVDSGEQQLLVPGFDQGGWTKAVEGWLRFTRAEQRHLEVLGVAATRQDQGGEADRGTNNAGRESHRSSTRWAAPALVPAAGSVRGDG